MSRKHVSYILYGIHLAAASLFIYIIWSNNLFPSNYRIVISMVSVLILLVLFCMISSSGKGILYRKITATVLGVMILLNGLSAFYICQGVYALETLKTNQEKKIVSFSMIVLKDSEVKDMGTSEIESVLAPIEQDKVNIKLLTSSGKLKSTSFINTKNYVEAFKTLLENKGKVVLLNEAYRDLVLEHIPDLNERTEVIESFKIEAENKDILKDVEKGESFTAYLSGVDSYNDITAVSRSDFNMLVTVNLKAGKILITSIPRDTYLPILGGGKEQYDKHKLCKYIWYGDSSKDFRRFF